MNTITYRKQDDQSMPDNTYATDMTVVNRNLIREDQLTGDKVTLQGYAPGMSLTFPVACVVSHCSDLSFPMTVAAVDILDDNGMVVLLVLMLI